MFNSEVLKGLSAIDETNEEFDDNEVSQIKPKKKKVKAKSPQKSTTQ